MIETYKTFRGLIYILLIGGIVVFLTLHFSGNSQKQQHTPDSTYMRLLEDKANLKTKAEILEFQTAQLQIQLSDIMAKEKPVKTYYINKKRSYPARAGEDTDQEFLNIFK